MDTQRVGYDRATNTMQKQKNPDLNLIPFTKINSKGIIYLLIKCKAIKLFKENIKENLCDLGLGKDF